MYASKFGPVMEEMLTIRHRSGLQLKFIGFFLDDFDAFCAREYPEATLLTKEIAETWIHSSDSPSRHHMARRVLTMKHIGEYQQSLGLNAYVPNYRIKRPKAEEPHLFTDEQLALFFETVDTKLIPTETYPYKDTMFPVFFRLVYCCGLRSSEACNLKVSDIDFPKGTICIYQSKGMKDRELPLSDDLLDLCYRFDRYYQKQFPDRTYFFKPNQEREHMTSADVSKIFQAILKKAGLLELPGKRFTTHGLRHLFAVQNIKNALTQEKISITGFSIFAGTWDTSTSAILCTICISPHSFSLFTGRSWTPLRKESVWSMRKNKQKPKKMFFIYTKDFFNHLRSELHSERTIETYCQSLNAFRIYLYETYSKTVDQITIDFVTEEVIREFLSSVADSNSVGTRNVRLSGIKAYLKYAATRDMELVPLQISISAVKHKKTYPKRHNWLDKADIELILAQPPQTKIGIRDRFIILFLFSTGARLAEMRSVQLKDVIINEKYPYIRITGKGNKPRIVPIPEDSFLKNYKYYCHLYHPKENPDDYLFYPTAKGGREMMSEDNVQRILKKYGDAARCSNPKLPSIHPHLLRHSYGAQLYRLGVSLPEIAKLLGHEDISTTEIYAETDPEMAAEAISKMLGKQPVRKWDFLTEDES